MSHHDEHHHQGTGNFFLDLLVPHSPHDDAHRTREAIERMARSQESALSQLSGAQGAVAAGAADARERLVRLQLQVDKLQQQLFSTALYCRTLLQVLVDKRIITVAEFTERMDQVDLLDGKRDGR